MASLPLSLKDRVIEAFEGSSKEASLAVCGQMAFYVDKETLKFIKALWSCHKTWERGRTYSNPDWISTADMRYHKSLSRLSEFAVKVGLEAGYTTNFRSVRWGLRTVFYPGFIWVALPAGVVTFPSPRYPDLTLGDPPCEPSTSQGTLILQYILEPEIARLSVYDYILA